MGSKNTRDLSFQVAAMDTLPMGSVTRPLEYYRGDTDKQPIPDTLPTTDPIPAVEGYPPKPYQQAANQGAYRWDDLARLNALINHCRCTVHAKNGDLWQRVQLVHQGDALLRVSVEQVSGMPKLIETMPRLVLYLADGSLETCERVNTMLKYNRETVMFADIGTFMPRIQAIRPLAGHWLECILFETNDSVHIARRYYEPFLLTL